MPIASKGAAVTGGASELGQATAKPLVAAGAVVATFETQTRCTWAGDKPEMIAYHDAEWGVPVHNDRVLFEFLTLEAAQAGLSWYTVLRKREAYRAAFAAFEVQKIARFSDRKVEQLLANAGIIRNRAKINAAINNARCFIAIQEAYGSFDTYCWGFVGGAPIINRPRVLQEVPATSSISDALAKDLKQRGFKFLGSTIVYAHMQATGMVNDHLVDCFRHREVQHA